MTSSRPPVPTLLVTSDVVAVAKPPGVSVIPERSGPPEDCLRGRLEAERAERLWVVHRIDRDTSGVVVFARTADAHRRWSMAFERHQVRKQYLAWTLPAPPALSGVIEVPLHTARKGKMRPALAGEPQSRPSETLYDVERVSATASGAIARLRCVPRTGRQHQIRVHLRSIGAPLLVDPLYARREAFDTGGLGPGSPTIRRLTLHAWRLSARTPDVGGAHDLDIEAPLPDDLAALDGWLAELPQS